MEPLVWAAHVAVACSCCAERPVSFCAFSPVLQRNRSALVVFQTLPGSHSCIFLLHNTRSNFSSLLPPLLHCLGAHSDSQRGHGDGGNSLPRGAQLLLHQPGCGHRVHRAVHHPHRGRHHCLAAPRRRLGAVTPHE